MNALLVSMVVVAPVLARFEPQADATKLAIDKGLARIEQGAANYTTKRQCFSCHHQAMSILTMTSAAQRGFTIDPAKLRKQVEFTLASFRPNNEQIAKGTGVPGGNTMAAYALFALAAAAQPRDETTSGLVAYLLVRQHENGSWRAVAKRPPSEESPFTDTALALIVLDAYGPTKDGNDEVRQKVEEARSRGREWLLNNKPETTEDKVFHLRGLVHTRADRAVIEAARELLLKEQREDGGWAQLPERESDAYATGSVLVALRGAGIKSDDPAYVRGVKHLLATQREDGAWIVETRSRPVQVFFDNGDPGGKSQFISFAATNWALLALLETIPAK